MVEIRVPKLIGYQNVTYKPCMIIQLELIKYLWRSIAITFVR